MDTHDVRMTGEVAVDVPPSQMFRLWRNPENLPALVGHLAAVERREGRRSRWTARGADAPPIVWDVEAEDEVENERLAWRSLPGAAVASAASVSFAPLDAGAATRVRLEMCYAPGAGASATDVARLVGARSEGLTDDLVRMKHRIEAGETIGRDEVEEASRESFPASDPPAWTTGKS